MKKLLLISIFCCINLTAQVIYVNQSATGLDNGSDWANAFIALQDAISLSHTGDEIWVANGTYTPVPIGSYNPYSSERGISFLLNDISLYGGFLGNMSETSIYDRNINNIENLQTILSGDINNDDETVGIDENTSQVIGCSGNFILDGLVVVSGYASIMSKTSGGGIFIGSGEGTISNCYFSSNRSTGSGGAICINSEAIVIINSCYFVRNHSSYGGAIYASGESVIISNSVFENNSSLVVSSAIDARDNTQILRCIFNNNLAIQQESAVSLYGNAKMENSIIINNNSGFDITVYCSSYSKVFNTLIAYNTAGSETAGIKCGSFTMHNSIVRNNTVAGQPSNISRFFGANPTILNSNIEQDSTNAWVFNEPSNFDLEPLFVDVSTSDFRLLAGSPCIDFGRLDDESPRMDYAGNPRVGNPDIGPYEFYTGDPVFTISGSVVGLLDASNVIVRATSGSTRAEYYCSSAGRFDFTFYSGEYTLTPVKSGYAFSPSETVVTLSDANVSGIVFTMTEAPEKPEKDDDRWYHCAMTERYRGDLRLWVSLLILSLGFTRYSKSGHHCHSRQ